MRDAGSGELFVQGRAKFFCAKFGTYKEVCEEYYGQHVSWPAVGYSACV